MVSISSEIAFAIFAITFAVSNLAAHSITYGVIHGDPMTTELSIIMAYTVGMILFSGRGMWRNRDGI